MTCFQTFLRMMSSSHAHGSSVIAYNFKGECRKQQTDLHYKFRGGFCIYHGSGTFCDSIPALRAAGMGFGMPNPIPKYGNTLEVYQESQTYQRLVVLCLVYQKAC